MNATLLSRFERHVDLPPCVLLVEDRLEREGVVVNFSAGRGYGFVSFDDGTSALLHVSVLKGFGCQSIFAGSRIHCSIRLRAKGWAVEKIHSIDQADGRPELRFLSDVPNARVVATSELDRAEVLWFNYRRGFGLLMSIEHGHEIFVHMEVLRRNGILELRQGQNVVVRYGVGPKGFVASEIRSEQSEMRGLSS